MWYRQTLEVVRIRNALRALAAEAALADGGSWTEAAARALEELRQIADDEEHPAGGRDLRREYDRWCTRIAALAAAARNN